MKIVRTSGFKNPALDHARYEAWVKDLEKLNHKKYERLEVQTGLGKTLVWGLNTASASDALVIFPGFRTTSLFWDLDNGLSGLEKKFRIFLVETNGQPNASDGHSPAIRSLDYGTWAAQVLDGLGLHKTYVAGASFGAMVCMKLATTEPDRVKAAFLLNPGGIAPLSLGFRNLYYNLLPLLFPSKRTIKKFLRRGVFHEPVHQLSPAAMQLCIDFELLAITRYRDKTQKPYYMGDEIKAIKAPVYLLVGNKDLLFPFKKTVRNASAKISSLRETIVFENVGHASETYPGAMKKIELLIESENELSS